MICTLYSTAVKEEKLSFESNGDMRYKKAWRNNYFSLCVRLLAEQELGSKALNELKMSNRNFTCRERGQKQNQRIEGEGRRLNIESKPYFKAEQ